jgi:hypothetical protein
MHVDRGRPSGCPDNTLASANKKLPTSAAAPPQHSFTSSLLRAFAYIVILSITRLVLSRLVPRSPASGDLLTTASVYLRILLLLLRGFTASSAVVFRHGCIKRLVHLGDGQSAPVHHPRGCTAIEM